MDYLHFSFFHITVIYAIMSLSVTIFEVPTGILADKFSRKYSIFGGQCLGILLTLSLLFFKNFYFFIIWAILSGLEYSLSSGSIVSLVYDNMKYLGIEEDFPKVQSNYKSTMEISIFVSGFLSGFIASISFSLAIYLTALVKITSILVLLTIKEYPYKAKERRRVAEIWKNSLSFLKSNHMLIHMIVIFIFVEIFIDTLMSLSQAYIYFIMPSLPIVTISLSFVYISSIIGYKTPYKFQRKIYPWAPFIIGLIVIFLGIYHTWLSILFMICIQIINAMFIIIWQTNFQKSIPSEERATLTSFTYFIITFILFIFYTTYGYIVDIVGLFNAIFYTSTAFFIMFLIYYLTICRKVRF